MRERVPASTVMAFFAFPVVVACTGLAGERLAADAQPRGGKDPATAGETLLLQDPALGPQNVVFVYAQDLWVAPRGGGTARRLTSSSGTESHPRISPDGQFVAFTGQYEGNSDVYVIPLAGGAPRRLTWHPGVDRVVDWNPDGKSILFASSRESGAPVDRLFLVDVQGGPERALPVPRVYHATYAADGAHLAYTVIADAFRTWKRYRGGTMGPIWILDLKTLDVEEVPHERASDTFPCFAGDSLFFASDRDLHMNVWRYARDSKQVTQVTHFTDYDVRNMTSDGSTVVFEQGGRLHLLDPKSSAVTTLHITVPNDGLYAIPRWEDAKGSIRNAEIAPNGKRAVFEARGEIVTVPKEHGDARNLTQSPGVHDRDPEWSPDGKSIAWFSDASGEYQLEVADQLGREAPRSFPITGGAGFYRNPTWSPDSKKIAFVDKAGRLAYLTPENGAITEIARLAGSLGEVQSSIAWSPDSKWIAYEAPDSKTLYSRIALFDVQSGNSTVLTDAFGDCGSPVFSRDMKHLFFTASIESGPTQFGLNMNAGAHRDGDNSIYVAVLQKSGKNPLFPKSDEGVPSDDDKKGKGDASDAAPPAKDAAKTAETAAADAPKDAAKKDGEKDANAKKKELPALELDGLDQRILALPLPASRYRRLATTKDKLLFIENGDGSGGSDLKAFDFDSKKAETIVAKAGSVKVSADGESLLVGVAGSYQITNASGKDGKPIAIESVKLKVDPTAEWPEILRDAWRIERDYFYDPNMHGVDWPAMWERWSAFLPHVRHRDDLNLLISEMIGELCCGHEYVSGGESPSPPDGVSVGLLGCDVTIDQGRYKITRIYRGQNWNVGLRAPLFEPGVDAHVGDYIVRVNGIDLTADQNFFRAFENTANRQVDLELSAKADGSDPRKMKVVPLASEASLRRMAWVEQNRKRVDELSGGKLAYVYMPNTGDQGEAAFDRDFYSQIDKAGLVLDERFNGGGKVADYVVDVLERKRRCLWMTREAWLGQTPYGIIDGPKVMIINERAGSGGDCMPWMFQNAKIGKLVGTRTWGGLVGISAYPPLMDGGSVTAASFGVMDVNGEWAVENEGVTPDFPVVEYPKDIVAGRDPQLEKAVEIALAELAARPAAKVPGYKPPKKR